MPPEEPIKGYFNGKDEETVKLVVKDIVYRVLAERELTQRDEQAIREAIKDMLELTLTSHHAKCVKERSEQGHSSLTIIVSAISLLVAIAALAAMLYKG